MEDENQDAKNKVILEKLILDFMKKKNVSEEFARNWINSTQDKSIMTPNYVEGRPKPAIEESRKILEEAFKGTKLKPVWTKEKGWGLVAIKNISTGALIFTDEPFVCCNVDSDSCEYCGDILDLKSFIKCESCGLVKYCSTKCKDDDFAKYHRIICGVDVEPMKEFARTGMSSSAKIGYLTFKIIAMLLNANISSYWDHPWLKLLCTINDVKMSPSFKYHYEFLTKAFLLKKGADFPYIQAVQAYIGADKVDDYLKLSLILIPNIYGCGNEKNDIMQRLGGSGVAAFGRASFFNHSCAPNGNYTISSNGTYKLIASKKINAGEEVSVAYLNTTDDYQLRRLNLSQRYGFECKCSKCLTKK